MKNLSIWILASVLLTISCTGADNNEDLNHETIENEVASVLEAYVEQVNSKGIQGLEAYFSEDKRFYWVEDGKLQYPNRDSLVAGIAQFFPQVDSVNMVIYKKEIQVIDPNYASLYTEYGEDFVLNSGYAFRLDGAFTALMIREDSTWKFLNGHSSIKKPRE